MSTVAAASVRLPHGSADDPQGLEPATVPEVANPDRPRPHRPRLTRPGVTLADYSLATFEAYWRAAGLPIESYPAIVAWGTRLCELAAWQKSAPRRAQDSAA